MYDTDALLLPFLQLIILSVSQCLKYSTGISEMWTGEKCKLFINFFFNWRLDLSISVPIWRVGVIIIFKGKIRRFSLLDNLAQKGVFWLKQKCSRYQRFAWFRCVFCIYSWSALLKRSSVSNCLGCSGKLVFAVFIFKQFNVLLSSLQTPPAAVFTLFICGQQALRQKLLVLCGKEDVFSKWGVQNQVNIKIHK